ASIAIAVACLDATAYLMHRLYHRNPWLWRLHAVHHSDDELNFSSALRFHFGEVALSLAVRCAVILALGLPILGILVFEIVFAFFNALEHASVKFNQNFESLLGLLFVTPALHRKHHSQIDSELNSNYSTIFSFWDRLSRTFTPARAKD